jgi:hypothetical protein
MDGTIARRAGDPFFYKFRSRQRFGAQENAVALFNEWCANHMRDSFLLRALRSFETPDLK